MKAFMRAPYIAVLILSLWLTQLNAGKATLKPVNTLFYCTTAASTVTVGPQMTPRGPACTAIPAFFISEE